MHTQNNDLWDLNNDLMNLKFPEIFASTQGYTYHSKMKKPAQLIYFEPFVTQQILNFLR